MLFFMMRNLLDIDFYESIISDELKEIKPK
jgi:hypothetical protein